MTRALRWTRLRLACAVGLGGHVAAAPQGALGPDAGPTPTVGNQSWLHAGASNAS